VSDELAPELRARSHQTHKVKKLRWITLLAGAGVGFLASSAIGKESVKPSPSTLVVTPATTMAVSGPRGGPFSPASFQYRVSASVGTVSYSIRAPSWLTISSSFGTVGTSGVTITLTVNPTAGHLQPGVYGPGVAFTNVTNGRGSTIRTAILRIGARSSAGSVLDDRGGVRAPPSAGSVPDNRGGYLLDGYGGYLLNDGGERLLAR
jgi:hypothetical protein